MLGCRDGIVEEMGLQMVQLGVEIGIHQWILEPAGESHAKEACEVR